MYIPVRTRLLQCIDYSAVVRRVGVWIMYLMVGDERSGKAYVVSCLKRRKEKLASIGEMLPLSQPLPKLSWYVLVSRYPRFFFMTDLAVK